MIIVTKKKGKLILFQLWFACFGVSQFSISETFSSLLSVVIVLGLIQRLLTCSKPAHPKIELVLSPCVQYNIRRDAVLLNESSDDGLQLNIFKSALFFVILVKHFSSRSRNHLPLVMNLAVLPAVYARCSLMMNLSTNSCPLIS